MNAAAVSARARDAMGAPWLGGLRWDATWLIGSAAIVPLVLIFVWAGVPNAWLNLAVTTIVGGPHLFATYTATYMDPRFRRSHLPLLVDAQRKKLSKRRHAVAVEHYRDRGYLPEAFVNQDYWQSLYVTFADAWRITDATSLFDYPPGQSTATYTLREFPADPGKLITIDDLTPAEGQVLTASNTLADEDGISGPIAYQWQRNGVNIAGATGATYTTTQADVGAALRVVASYTDDQGTPESVSSAATAAVTNVNSAPTGIVTIDNTMPAEGDVLTASNTLADADGLSGPITYQWQRNGVDIAGATGATYTTTQADVGAAITVVASYTDDQATAESMSSTATASVTNVNAAPTGIVAIDNTTPAEGDILTANNTLADADGLSGPISYQWRRDGVDVVGATGSTYATTQADLGAVLTVVASYTDDQGTPENSPSAGTAPVTAGNSPPPTASPPSAPPPPAPSPEEPSDVGNPAGDLGGEASLVAPSAAGGGNGGSADSRTFGSDAVGTPDVEVLGDDPGLPDRDVTVTAATQDGPGFDDDRPANLPPSRRGGTSFGGADGRGGVQFLADLEPPVPPISRELAAALDELAKSDQPAPIDLRMTGAVVASVSLSAGFVAWMLRSGALLASLLATRPMWTSFDPLPIFDRRDKQTDADPVHPNKERRRHALEPEEQESCK